MVSGSFKFVKLLLAGVDLQEFYFFSKSSIFFSFARTTGQRRVFTAYTSCVMLVEMKLLTKEILSINETICL